MGFSYIYDNMKLLSIFKNLISESVFVKKFHYGSQPIEIVKTYESLRSSSNTGEFVRVSPDEILDSMSDIYDVIINQAHDVLISCKNRCSLLIRDYRFGLNFDYQLFINYKEKDNILKFTINTSIRHPKKLYNNHQKTREILITKNDSIIIREDFNLNHFTKIVKGNIIIYII